MKKIKIFLASSKELKPERDRFEQEIYRKCKAWFDRGVFLHLDIWEDLSARLASDGSQSEYNNYVREADLFVLLAWTKMGMYTEEEFEQAFGQFQSKNKPFIFTYFKTADNVPTDPSLDVFKQKLSDLKHFYAVFNNEDDLWNQFNKELERLEEVGFVEFRREEKTTIVSIENSKNVVLDASITAGGDVHIGDTTIQNAGKIYNIGHIDNANFS
ncbi:MAG: hypothetical protein J0L99_07540 [Chitinophagales bacterium]|nr:hypothetical protein [Chitinophagales bacterium]